MSAAFAHVTSPAAGNGPLDFYVWGGWLIICLSAAAAIAGALALRWLLAEVTR